MKRMAHIKDGKVVNVSLWDGATSWQPDENAIEIPDDMAVAIGWSYQDGLFVAPEPEPEPTLDAKDARAAAYRAEADPIFFKYQRGEATEREWLDKIEEIRARYPYPEGDTE